MKDLTIKLFETFGELSFREESGALITKVVDVADLHAIFKDNTNHDTGDLPVVGTDAMGISRVITRGNKLFVIVSANNPCFSVNINGENLPNVYYPGLLMAVHVTKVGNDYRVDDNKTIIVAYKHMIAGKETQLYQFPYANVYDGISNICWGYQRIPRLTSPGQAVGILQLFLTANMNNDLASYAGLLGGHGDKYRVGNLPRMLRLLSEDSENLEHFPFDDILLQAKWTYGDFISHCENNL